MTTMLLRPLFILTLAISFLTWSAAAAQVGEAEAQTPNERTAPTQPSGRVTAGVKCLPHDAAAANLKRHYGEDPIGVGLSNKGRSVVELYVAETGTWTILVTDTRGTSCVAAAGQSWSGTSIVDTAEDGA